MPQPKGHSPFSRFWTVNYKVIFKSAAIPADTLLARPRSEIFLTKSDAQAFYDGLKSQEASTVGHPAPGTIQAPFEEDFRNAKTFVQTFVNEHVAFVRVSSS
jgi:hypothetical protein